MDKAIAFYQVMFSGLFDLFDRLDEYYGIWSIVYGLFIIFLSVKFLLNPVVGGSIFSLGSDSAKGKKKRVKKDKGK